HLPRHHQNDELCGVESPRVQQRPATPDADQAAHEESPGEDEARRGGGGASQGYFSSRMKRLVNSQAPVASRPMVPPAPRCVMRVRTHLRGWTVSLCCALPPTVTTGSASLLATRQSQTSSNSPYSFWVVMEPFSLPS